MPNWEKVEVPRGTFIGWGSKVGQFIEGKVLDYEVKGGTNFAGDPCPLLEVELSKRAASFDKGGTRTNFDPGETVAVTCGQKQLERAIKKADPSPNDLIRIELVDLEPAGAGEVKIFEISIARAKPVRAVRDEEPVIKELDPEPAAAPEDDEPPF